MLDYIWLIILIYPGISVMVHELAHAMAATIMHEHLSKVEIAKDGGFIRLASPCMSERVFLITAAGPAADAVTALACINSDVLWPVAIHRAWQLAWSFHEEGDFPWMMQLARPGMIVVNGP